MQSRKSLPKNYSIHKNQWDLIIASETLPTAAKAYSHLLHSSLGQNSALSSSSTYGIFSLDSSGVGRGNTRGGFRGRMEVVDFVVVVLVEVAVLLAKET